MDVTDKYSILERRFISRCTHCGAPNPVVVMKIVGVKEHGEFTHKCYECGKFYKIEY